MNKTGSQGLTKNFTFVESKSRMSYENPKITIVELKRIIMSKPGSKVDGINSSQT